MRIEMPKEIKITLTSTEEETIINCISVLEEMKMQMEDNDYVYMESTGYGQVSTGEIEDTIDALEAILNAEIVYQDKERRK